LGTLDNRRIHSITHRADSGGPLNYRINGVGLNKADRLSGTPTALLGDRSTNDASGDAVI